MPRDLRLKSTRPPHSGVQISVPTYIHEYFTLFVCAKGITKSHVLKSYLFEWFKTHREQYPDDILIQELADRLIDHYREDYDIRTYPIEKYKIDMREKLVKQYLKESYIDKIIEKITI